VHFQFWGDRTVLINQGLAVVDKMELTIDQSCSFRMSLVGYQFPELEDVEFDSNWLNVKIAVSHQRGKWSAVDPALLTYEVKDLIDWLKELSVGKYDKRHLWFTEPCISFHLSPTEGAPDRLVIRFSHEFKPPWATEDLDEEHQIAFSLARIDLISAAQLLENQLRHYPQRTEY
jgi:hypothetical protein